MSLSPRAADPPRLPRSHRYLARVTWTGNLGAGTDRYDGYSRDHTIRCRGAPQLPGSSDASFRGDPGRYSPEDLLVASLAACHMLWYLHLCADAGIVVVAYEDEATGRMTEHPGSGGAFEEVTLRPRVTIQPPADLEQAAGLHERAHDLCYIAASMGFPVRCIPVMVHAAPSDSHGGISPTRIEVDEGDTSS